MRELFEVPELVAVAIEDEQSGVAFYGTLAMKDWEPAFKELFTRLREQEKYHERRFRDMLSAMGDYRPKEDYDGEYVAYLRAMTGSRAFPNAVAAAASAKGCPSPREAIELATRFERDTLILMKELAPLVPPADQSIVEELAREEQAHLVHLSDARRLLRPEAAPTT